MRARYDAFGIGLGLALATPGALMVALGFIGYGTIWDLLFALGAGLGVPALLWVGLAQGTYISIDKNANLSNTVFFLQERPIPLSKLVSIDVRKDFGGLLTFVSKTYHDKNNNLVTRGLAAKETVRKEDFKKLIEALSSVNPRIEIPKELRP